LLTKEIKGILAEEGYELLSDYVNQRRTKIVYMCPQGHEHKMRWDDWKKGGRCALCQIESQVSKMELQLRKYVTSLGYDFIPNDRTTVVNEESGHFLELDLWFPDIRKAIEFNGTYWHQSEKRKKKDNIKKEFCDWKGINLMIVEEEDWSNRREEVEGTVREFLENSCGG
jgi:hypothetical protein